MADRFVGALSESPVPYWLFLAGSKLTVVKLPDDDDRNESSGAGEGFDMARIKLQ